MNRQDLSMVHSSYPVLAERLAEAGRFEVIKVYRDGPRYWVARVRRDGEDLIVKMVIDDSAYANPETGEVFQPSDQLRAETLVGKMLDELRDEIKGVVPRIMAFGLDSPGWLLRSALPGHTLAQSNSPFVVRHELFGEHITEAVLDYIEGYQRLTPHVAGFLKPGPLRYIPAQDYREPVELLAPYARAVWGYLEERFDLYDEHLTCLSHGQAFPPHFYVSEGRVGMIDWENAALKNRLHDLASVWIRGYAHPAWQEEFLERLKSRGFLVSAVDWELWHTEVLMQSSGNLAYLHWSAVETAAEKTLAIAGLRRQIEHILHKA
ncbi:MAG: hypothetical protein JWN01_504 [Patescibacteria group bacterium]|nr:hypothetical protein [Patescibacteria group bacterium]